MLYMIRLSATVVVAVGWLDHVKQVQQLFGTALAVMPLVSAVLCGGYI